MPERPDLRQIAVSLREALDGLEREALIDVLTYVLNEYVVEGPPPLAPAQVERLEDLASLDLAALISALQLRLDTPGLELFRVEAGEVRVQTASGWVPLQPGRAQTSPAAAPPPPASPTRPGASFDERPMPRPGATGRAAADEAVSRGRGDLVGGERGVITPPAPRPRGLSVTGRATSGAAPAERPAQPPPQQPQQPAPAQPPPAQQQQPAAPPQQPQQPGGERKEDDASIRFSLLELD
ncbi:MAG TPA: hypothetical protein VFU21_29095 [Kofleriaceae bacterium]|nr:hypothetical protein [Kofleriaceae bacterium]